jgi:hypothetical protein
MEMTNIKSITVDSDISEDCTIISPFPNLCPACVLFWRIPSATPIRTLNALLKNARDLEIVTSDSECLLESSKGLCIMEII